MSKILKNTTGSNISILDTGVTILANSQYTIPPQDYLLWAASVNIVAFVNSGNIVVNNGTYDLSPADGIRFLQYPDRLLIKQNGTSITDVTTELNFVGSVSVTNNTNGRATVSVSSTAVVEPCLREVTLVMLGDTIPMNIESNLLFEPDPINNTIKFYKEETL